MLEHLLFARARSGLPDQLMAVVDFQKAYNSVSFAMLRVSPLYTGLPVAYVNVLMLVMLGPVVFCVGRGFVPDVELVVYGGWQMFLPTENCTLYVLCLRQSACHRGWSPLPSLLPNLPNLVPNPQPRVQPNLLPRWQPSPQPSLQLESPFLSPPLRIPQPKKVAHRASFWQAPCGTTPALAVVGLPRFFLSPFHRM